MPSSDTHHVGIDGDSFTDIQSNDYQTDPFQSLGRADQGILNLRNEICSGAFHNSVERDPPPKCHPDTRKAVLEDILRWLASSDPENNILWLYGPAGAGKSAIAQTVAERTEGRELAASFFFSYSIPGRNTIQAFWATLAFQIAISIPDLRNSIGTAVIDNRGTSFKSVESQLQKLIIEPFRSHVMDSNASQRSPFLVIIDGFDECKSEADQLLILNSISTITHTLNIPLRFIIASRPEPHIRSSFDSPDLRHICYRIVLDESFKPVEDVTLFLRSELGNIYEKHRHKKASVPIPWPSESEVQLLAERSAGQFIYASTALKFIDDEACHPVEQLKIVLDTSTAFVDLDQLYKKILSTSANGPLILRILGCILIAKEDLSVATIEDFLKLQVGDVHLALRTVHSIVNVPDASTDPVHVLHKSLDGFIFNPFRSGEYYIAAEKCHFNLAVGCLRWVLDAGKFYEKMCHRSLPGVMLLSGTYACRHWADHCSKAEPKHELVPYLLALDHHSWSILLHDDQRKVSWVNVMKLNKTVQWLQGLDSRAAPGSRDLARQLHNLCDQKLLQLELDPQCFLQCFFTSFTSLHVCILSKLAHHADVRGSLYFGSGHDDDKLGMLDKFRLNTDGYKHECLAISCLEFLLATETPEVSAQRSIRSAIDGHDISASNLQLRGLVRGAAMNYAKNHWARHLVATRIDSVGMLSRCHFCNRSQVDVCDYLTQLAPLFDLLNLNGEDAQLVVQMLRGVPNVRRGLLSQWEDIAYQSCMKGVKKFDPYVKKVDADQQLFEAAGGLPTKRRNPRALLKGVDPYKDSRQTEIVRSEFPVTNGDDQVHHNLSNGRVSEPERDYHSPTAAPAAAQESHHYTPRQTVHSAEMQGCSCLIN